MSQEVLLKVKDLRTEFFTSKTSSVTAVANISFDMVADFLFFWRLR